MRKTIRSKTLAEKRRRKNIISLIALAIFILVLFLFLVWASYHEKFLVKEIEVTGSLKTDKAKIESVARGALGGYALLFFPHRNFVFVPVKEIEREISLLDPVIKEAHVRRIGSEKLYVEVVEREPYVLWCGQDSSCFYADDSGVVFLPAPRFSGNTYPVYSSSISGEPIGKSFAKTEELARLESFRRFLEEMNFGVDKVVLREDGDYEAVMETGSKIIFNLADIDEEATNIKMLLESEESVGEGFNFNELDYIDLRYGNKIFWKPLTAE